MYKKIQRFLNSQNPGNIFLLSVGFSIALLITRILYTGSLHFLFLAWNLFLAFVPYWISTVMLKVNKWKWYKLLPMFLIWIIFLPNAPYIVTDFFHLHQNSDAPAWYDLMLILSFAWNGLLFWITSIYNIESVFSDKLPRTFLNIGIWVVILLSGAGVYIGRFVRWNSWDLFLHPFRVTTDVFMMILNPFSFPGFYGMTLTISVFLLLFYFFIEMLTKARNPIETVK